MAALTAADWTVTPDTTHNAIITGTGAKRRFRGTCALPGTSTYPTGGVPLPTFTALGFVRQLDTFNVLGVDGAVTTRFTPNVDTQNGKLQLFDGAATPAEMSNAVAPGPITFHVEAWGW